MDPEKFLDALLSLPGVWGGDVSPDGKWVAWTWGRVGPASDVFLAPADGKLPPVRMTNTAEYTGLTSWTFDNRAILVDEDKGGNERSRIFKVGLGDPANMIPLTEEDPEHFIEGGQLHPNDRWLVYGANYDFAGKKEIEQTCVIRHDLKNGRRQTLARPEKGGFISPELNVQGTHIIYSRNDLNPEGKQLWLVDIDGKEDREILNFGDDVKVESTTWFRDGRRVLFLVEAATYRKLGVWHMDGSIRWLLDDPSRNLEYAHIPFRGDVAVVGELKESRERASFVNLETGDEFKLPEIPGELTPLAPVGKNEWVGLYSASNHPSDVVRFSIDNPNPASFLSLCRVWKRTSLKHEDLIAAEDFRWKSADGSPIQGWLYRARGKPKGTIVEIHGGPTWYSGDSLDIGMQFLVNRGFNVLAPNYRGSTGFNLEFQESIKEDGWGGREQDDIRAGIESLIDAGIAEPGKVGVTGTSYGGYSSWHAITHFPPEIVAAAAPVCGMTDLIVDYNSTRPDLRPYSEEMMGGSPQQVPEKYFERSPINFLGNIKGRLLIVQGMQDPNVTPENVRVVRDKLDSGGIKYDVLAFDDEGHGIGRPKNLKTLYLQLADFFEKAFD